MNLGKKNENIIKVKTLYEYCVTLPRYEEVMNTTMESLNYIVVVLIVSAGLLAFAVLYNCSDIS